VKATPSNASLNQIVVLEPLIGLSVDLQNLNADVQRRWQLSIVQWLILKKIIDTPGLLSSSIAEISKVHPSTRTPTLSRFEGLGLIRQLERACDNRRKFIVASWKGME
jgi:DNA-binding MarR family transcriptional regulator